LAWGRSQSEIATSLGLDRKRVKKYLRPAIEAALTPGGKLRTREQWAELVRSWWPGLVDTRLRKTTWPQIEPHHEFIKSLLGVVTVATIWQRLRDERGLDVSVASLRRYGPANLPEDGMRSRVTVLRDNPPPVRRFRSTKAIWVRGWTQSAGAGGECGRSPWSWPARGTCSCARC
jgi:hypothetical protein